jgi:hypothetical protein
MKRNNIIMMSMNTKEIKGSMKNALVGIGVIVIVGLGAWLGYELIYSIKAEVAKGLAWMSGIV